MTELAFHFGAPDKLAYACRLLRKAVGSGANVVVVADPQAMAQLDADLWSISSTDFLPHCTGAATQSVQSRSPVLLVNHAGQAQGRHGVLVNLADAVPDGFEQFERLIEVVSTDAADRDLARSRWKFYAGRGLQITRHDLKPKSSE